MRYERHLNLPILLLIKIFLNFLALMHRFQGAFVDFSETDHILVVYIYIYKSFLCCVGLIFYT